MIRRDLGLYSVIVGVVASVGCWLKRLVVC